MFLLVVFIYLFMCLYIDDLQIDPNISGVIPRLSTIPSIRNIPDIKIGILLLRDFGRSATFIGLLIRFLHWWSPMELP